MPSQQDQLLKCEACERSFAQGDKVVLCFVRNYGEAGMPILSTRTCAKCARAAIDAIYEAIKCYQQNR